MFSPETPASVASDDRRREIIEATQVLIAEKGVEGLRIRDVAEKVGINNATLLYYFKTKEILIKAVVEAIVQALISTHDPRHVVGGDTPRDQLNAHFADILFQLRHTPARFIVLGELLMLAQHDSGVRAVLEQNDQEWHRFLVDILQRGVAGGQFHTAIDVSSTSHMIMMLLKGSNLQLTAAVDDIEQAIAQIKRWITA